MLLLIVLGSGTLIAQSSNTQVQIGAVRAHAGEYRNVDITMNSQPGEPAYGEFNLTIKYNPAELTPVWASYGPWFLSCGWEYFDWQVDNGLLRMQFKADMPNGNIHPSCYLNQYNGILATLRFLVESEQTNPCYNFTVDFFWDSCGANAFASSNQDTACVANAVTSLFNFGQDYSTPVSLNTIQGLPQSCLAGPIAGKTPVRSIDFISGGVQIQCVDPFDRRGDVNRNGVANEIADYVFFTNYFLYGLDVFNMTPPEYLNDYIAATDVNADNKTLTFADLVYLWRVIEGEVLPIPDKSKPVKFSAQFVQDVNAKVVSVSCTDSLAGAAFVFRGHIVPTSLLPPEVPFWFADSSGFTRVLFYPATPKTTYGSGSWFSYTGDGILTNVSTGDWSNDDVTPTISLVGYSPACGDVNGNGSVNISDAVYLIAFIFNAGPAPLDPKHGDINCDNICNISDAVYLVSYIFAGGPAPCQSCK
jgi:hypothetical protein